MMPNSDSRTDFPIRTSYPCKILIFLHTRQEFPCDCKRWVHKKCSGIKGPLRPDPEFRCARCLGTARAIDEREVSEVEVGNEKLDVVPEFCYLGDKLSAGGGCELAAITRCKCAWGKFRQLLTLLTNRHLPLLTRGKVYSSCDAACSRDLGHEGGYTEPSPA